MSAGVNQARTERSQALPVVSPVNLVSAWAPRALNRSMFAVVGLPALTLLLGTMVLTWTDADLALSQAFYDEHGACWPIAKTQPWLMLYEVGCLPGLSLGVSGLFAALVILGRKKAELDWRPGLFLALMLALGPGLLVNLCMKDHWGRPRPHEISHFGGDRHYHPVWCPGNQRGYSFPSGHAAMGFYLMAPGFLLWKDRRRIALSFFALGLTAGTMMGLARIVQGSHFATDILWSAGFVYFAGLGLSPLLLSEANRRRAPANTSHEVQLRIPPRQIPDLAGDTDAESPGLPKAA